MKWEYCVIEVKDFLESTDALKERLDKFGKERWELVSVNFYDSLVFFFKRERIDETKL